jgi:hypothetical protein
MKHFYLMIIAASVLATGEARAQSCNNIHFETADFTNWTGHTGYVPGPSWTAANLGMPPILANEPPATFQRFTILTVNGTDNNCVDPNTGITDPLMSYLAPGGGGVTVRLGNANTGGETERLRFSLNVTSFTASFIYKYALVMENPAGHMPSEQPSFMASFYDALGNPLPGLGTTILGSDSSLIYNNATLIAYKRWTTDTVDLSAYIGQTIIIEFITSDCTLGGHFGYAYIDCICTDNWTGVTAGSIGQFNIYPNPSDGKFTIEAFIPAREDVQIQVMNSIGQVIAAKELEQATGAIKEHIDIEGYAEGIYMLRLSAGKQTITRKISVR